MQLRHQQPNTFYPAYYYAVSWIYPAEIQSFIVEIAPSVQIVPSPFIVEGRKTAFDGCT